MVAGRPPATQPEDLPLHQLLSNEVSAVESLAEMEKRHIAPVHQRTGGNITRTADILKVDRVTVYDKIRKYGLDH